MSDFTQTTEATEAQDGLLGFNWDDGGSDSFFGIEGESTISTPTPTPTPVKKETEETEEPETTDDETIEKPKTKSKEESTETSETESFFGEEENTKESEGGKTEDGNFYEDVYKDLKEAGIFKHVELEEGEELSADRLYELQQEEIEAEVAARLDTWATKDLDEDAKAFIKFKIEGGDTSEFFKTYGSNSDISEGDISDENYQDKLIRAQLAKEGWDNEEIEDRLEYLTDSNKKEKVAEKYFEKLQKEREKEKEILAQKAIEQKQAIKEQEEKFKSSIKEILETSKEIKGIKLADKDKGEILNFLTKRDQKIDDNRTVTGFQKKLSEVFTDPSKVVILAKLINDDFDFSSLEKAIGTKKTKEIKRNIEQRQSVRPSGSGSSSGANSLSSLFDK